MSKSIILCSDGTGNTFGSHTNVRRMVECVSLKDSDHQRVIYDQGVGTREGKSPEFDEYFKRNSTNLRTLEGKPLPLPEALLHQALGLTIGKGIDENIKQLYVALADWY